MKIEKEKEMVYLHRGNCEEWFLYTFFDKIFCLLSNCGIALSSTLPILQDCLHLAKYSSEMRHFISVITYFIFEHWKLLENVPKKTSIFFHPMPMFWHIFKYLSRYLFVQIAVLYNAKNCFVTEKTMIWHSKN